MKKLLLLAIVVSLFAGMASAAKVPFIPVPGIQVHGTATEERGKIFIGDNGNIYRQVYNDATVAAAQGYPAWYVATSGAPGNTWTVKSSYEATSDLEKFAGIWYCDADGNDAITASELGWIQIAGHCWASVEGTTDIGADDLLIGDTGGKYLIKGRDALTTLTCSSGEVTLTVPGPLAISAFTTNAAGTTEVFLRGLY